MNPLEMSHRQQIDTNDVTDTCLWLHRLSVCQDSNSSLCLLPLFQTPEDPASREILCCHGYQEDPPNIAADLYFYNADQCLRLKGTPPPRLLEMSQQPWNAPDPSEPQDATLTGSHLLQQGVMLA